MSKMHYFSNKFSKIAKRWWPSAPHHPLKLRFCWYEIVWFGHVWYFITDYDEIKLKKQLWRLATPVYDDINIYRPYDTNL